ncbi:NrfD/PsrC family molybdoenzyme membrane anchor subunit [Spirochaetota bacterium]
MSEITITTNKVARTMGESIGIWGWEVPLYLFLGGLTAGIMILSAIMMLRKKGKEFPLSTNRIILLAPVLISLGMFALFLDLEHKLYAWRFYTAFKITSVMSWGSWILVFVYPFTFFLILGTLKEGFPNAYIWIETKIKGAKSSRYIEWFNKLMSFALRHKTRFAWGTLVVGVLLGIYTGILLSAFGARPFWNSAILGPLFLVSGVSTGAAIIILLSKDHGERLFFTKIDLGLLITEALLIILFVIGMATSTAMHKTAANFILGGSMTPVFWIFILGIGISLPAFLEIMELKGREIPASLAAILVLMGGLLLRFIMVNAGQMISWLPY